ncbi:MAG: hypothetical protein GYA21_19665 [Myxococcales bacterium]|nr:hypothetical protein [Myxococcales bacterium]
MSVTGQAILMTLFMAYSIGFLFFIARASARHAPEAAPKKHTRLVTGVLVLGLPLCLLVLLAGLLQ